MDSGMTNKVKCESRRGYNSFPFSGCLKIYKLDPGGEREGADRGITAPTSSNSGAHPPYKTQTPQGSSVFMTSICNAYICKRN